MVTWAICVPSQGHREKSLWPGQESYFWENPPLGAAERKGRSSCGRHPAVCLSLRAEDTPLVPSNPATVGAHAIPSSSLLAAPASAGPAPPLGSLLRLQPAGSRAPLSLPLPGHPPSQSGSCWAETLAYVPHSRVGPGQPHFPGPHCTSSLCQVTLEKMRVLTS